ncbi:MAG: thioredoxin domain-containing protein, partial [Myxococcota bacterium]|nr:thioredoxin domain-containing protein [Myxococcota bacterium]
MAQSSNNATVIVTSVVVALISFGGGYFVGSHNVSTAKGDAASAAPGAGQSPTFGGAEGAAKAGDAFKGTPSTLTDSPQIPVGNSPVLGNPNAPVTIIEFSDFQCPFCQRGADTLKQVQKKYPNDVRVVFKNFPLAFHKEAPAASKAALAAGQQGKYWEMHDKLFENFRNFKANAADMKGYTAGLAGQIGLDVEQFKKDFDNPEFDKMIQADQALGSKLGVRGTPHFFINGVRLSGAQPLPKFEEIVQAQI